MKNNLQQLRWENGWSREQLHRISGVSSAAIMRIENNETCDPSVGTALLLAKALKVKVEDIFIL